MIEHVSDGCQCAGKKCLKCEQLRCVGMYTKDKRLRSGLVTRCKVCLNAQQREWREKNREQTRADALRRYYQDRDRQLELKRKRRESSDVKEQERARWKEYYRQHKEPLAKSKLDWFNSRPGYRIVIQANRRARERKNGGSFTLQQWNALKEEHNYTCLCCGKREPEIQLQADHIIPVFLNGSSHIENIQPLCKSCNLKKHTKIIDFRHKTLDN